MGRNNKLFYKRSGSQLGFFRENDTDVLDGQGNIGEYKKNSQQLIR